MVFSGRVSPEHQKVMDITISAANGRIPVLAGSGSNNTEEAIQLTMHAKSAGAAGCLLITPYYNRPTQEGLFQHFKKIAMEVDIPIVLYNVPSRTGVNLLPETVERLAEIKRTKMIYRFSADVSILLRRAQGFLGEYVQEKQHDPQHSTL